MPGKVSLVVKGGPLAGRRWDFEEHDVFIFGRNPDCHARLAEDDTTASRHHFLLEVNPPDASVRDLGSLNGTFVNGQKRGGRPPHETPEQAKLRIQDNVTLRHGDLVQIGATVFEVAIERPVVRPEEPPAPAPTVHPAEADPAEALKQMLIDAAKERGGPVPQDIEGHRVVKELGRGGMGAVYLAERLRDGAPVALKIMLARAAVHPKAREMFLRECRVASQLIHPNIVRCFEYGSSGSGFYCTMELCPAGNVFQLMMERRGRIPVAEAGPLMLQALDGLIYAHQADVEVDLKDGGKQRARGVVHRDLKPENLLLAGSPGRPMVKVADFGLAKAFDTAGLSGMTVGRAGGAGTIPFMAREQLLNFRDVRPVTDVWAIAATFYNMLTGAYVRDFPDGMDPMLAILQQPVVPIRNRHPAIPPRVAEAIDAALVDDTKRRTPTSADFRTALASALAS